MRPFYGYVPSDGVAVFHCDKPQRVAKCEVDVAGVDRFRSRLRRDGLQSLLCLLFVLAPFLAACVYLKRLSSGSGAAGFTNDFDTAQAEEGAGGMFRRQPLVESAIE